MGLRRVVDTSFLHVHPCSPHRLSPLLAPFTAPSHCFPRRLRPTHTPLQLASASYPLRASTVASGSGKPQRSHIPEHSYIFQSSPYGNHRRGQSADSVEQASDVVSASCGDAGRSGEGGSARANGIENDRVGDNGVTPIEEQPICDDEHGSPHFQSPSESQSHAQLVRALDALDDDPVARAGGGRLLTYRGSPTARLMVIGDYPSEDDDACGTVFSGNAGQLLDSIFAHAGFDVASQLYVTNVVKRRPPGGRKPTRKEVLFFLQWTRAELRAVDPAIVVLAGNVSTRAFLGSRVTMRSIRGTWLRHHLLIPITPSTPPKEEGKHEGERWVIPIFHPAYLLRKQSMKKEMVDDMDSIRDKYMALFPGHLRVDKL